MDTVAKLRKVFDSYFSVPLMVVPAIVKSFDSEQKTVDCEPIDGSADINDVRIKASVGEAEGVEIIPAIDSPVLVALILNNENAGFVVSWSKVEKVIIKPSVEIQLNGDALGGLCRIDPLLTKINQLETKIQNHQHLSANPGQPTTRDLATNPMFNNTEKSEIENEKVKHG